MMRLSGKNAPLSLKQKLEVGSLVSLHQSWMVLDLVFRPLFIKKSKLLVKKNK